jgi:DNA-binding transcriptional LysR family regulator
MQLREVTDSIGLTLYEVVPRRVVLTEAGEELARTARAIADQWEGFGQSVAAIKGLTRGRLRVQVVSTAKYFVRRLLGARFAAQRFKPIVRLELGNNEAIREAVAGGLGLAVLSGHALEGRAANPGVRILPVVGFPIPSKWHPVYLRSRDLSAIGAVFREHLLSEMQPTPVVV